MSTIKNEQGNRGDRPYRTVRALSLRDNLKPSSAGEPEKFELSGTALEAANYLNKEIGFARERQEGCSRQIKRLRERLHMHPERKPLIDQLFKERQSWVSKKKELQQLLKKIN